MDRKVLIVFISVLLLSAVLGTGLVTPSRASTTHEVYPGESIQEAINSAQSGDTIFVHVGTYYEHIILNKSLTLIGENRSTTVLDGKKSGSTAVIDVTTDNVKISGFTIQNSGKGIWAEPYCSGINVSGNVITSIGFGIDLLYSNGCNTITNNIITRVHDCGIRLGSHSVSTSVTGNFIKGGGNGIDVQSDGSIIMDNNVTSNGYIGIFLSSSSGNILRNNSLSGNKYNLVVYGRSLKDYMQGIDTSNTVDGKPICYWVNQHDRRVPADAGYVAAVKCTNITVKSLQLRGNGHGVLFVHTNSSIIENINASENLFCGFYLSNCSGVTIRGNTMINSDAADGEVALVGSSGNTIVNNTLISNSREGISLESSNNNKIVDNTVSRHRFSAISLLESRYNTIDSNEISSNFYYDPWFVYTGTGIEFHRSNENSISRNTISDNCLGISLWSSNSNRVYHNNFVNNSWQVESTYSSNTWDDGYPSGGNYWSDYIGVDLYSGPYQNETGSDGIGDTSHNQDGYPLMGPISFFEAGTWDEKTYYVHTVSNSTVSDFYFSEDDKLVSFNVTGPDDTVGFCRVAFPNELLWCDNPKDWIVLVNNTAVPYTIMQNDDYTYIYFTYNHSTLNIQIIGTEVIPEFQPSTILLLFIALTTLTVIFAKTRWFKEKKNQVTKREAWELKPHPE